MQIRLRWPPAGKKKGTWIGLAWIFKCQGFVKSMLNPSIAASFWQVLYQKP